MKNVLILVSLAISFSLHSQTTSRIIFIRNTDPVSLVKLNVFIDDTLVCRLASPRQSVHEVSPGKHSFMAQYTGKKAKEGAKREAITIDCEAGRTYYLSLIIQEKFALKNLYCEEVTEASWKKFYSRIKLEENCNVD